MLNLIEGLTKPTFGNIQINLENQTIEITKLILETIGYILQTSNYLETLQ